ncbi:outer membrane protein assembly factor BamB family protein [Catenuloplanes japonicus]|uniref:outer membrane protein assembly factor BamB family protein n=1 Tax=Catenuloplanes japonicus TaxID=33876 RepID=UPI0005262E10|nr:PQQ-binding-like beta-propeller repeat protein [Catenuloplanes japonicus]
MKKTALAAALLAALVPSPALAAPVDPVLVPPVADTDGPTPSMAAVLKQAWSVPAKGLTGDPLYFAGAVYYAESGGGRAGLVRRDTGTGKRQSFAPAVRGYGIASPVSDGDSVFTITTDDGVVRAYRPDGKPRWTAKLPGDVRTDWVLATGGLVLAAAEFRCGHHEGDVCERTELHAFRADTGRRTWIRKLAGGSPVATVAGGRIAVRTWQDRDELYGDDIIEPGKEPEPIVDDSPALVTVLTRKNVKVWQRAVPGGGEIAADADAVAVNGDRLCAYRATNGKTLWCAPTSHRYQDLAAADGRFYVGLNDAKIPDDHRVAALDGKTGRRLWTAQGARPYGGITSGNGVVWLVSNTDMPAGQLLALRATDGRELRRLPLGEYGGSKVALGVNRAFLFRDGQTVAAFR